MDWKTNFILLRKEEYINLGKCNLGECPQSKTLKDICCLDCDELELCIEKNYTCLHTLISKMVEDCDEYVLDKI